METIERSTRFGPTHIAPVPLGLSDTALVVIDMQSVWASRSARAAGTLSDEAADFWFGRIEQTVAPSIARLLAAFRERQMHVIHVVLGSDYQDMRDVPSTVRDYIRNLEQDSGLTDVFWSGNPNYGILPELAPKPGETVIQKRTWGSFSSSSFEEVLRGLGITSLVLTGCSTNCCVETTARDAFDRGYSTVVVDDGCADMNQEWHDATLAALHHNFCRVAGTVDEVVSAIDTKQPV